MSRNSWSQLASHLGAKGKLFLPESQFLYLKNGYDSGDNLNNMLI